MEYDISAILRENGTYSVNKVMKQRWQNTRFNYLDKPRPDHGLLFVTLGQILFRSDSEPVLAKAGDVIYLPKGSRYEAVILPEYGPTGDYLVNFDGDIRGGTCPVKALEAADPAYLDVFAQIMDRKLRREDSPLWIRGQFYILLDMLLRDLQRSADPQKGSMMRQARELLDRQELSVERIASICGISVSGFRATFRQSYGCSPQQYRMESKLSKAKYLLESTDLPVCAIAERLGFYDEAYFCKIFRSYTGCSPKTYRKSRSI